MTVIVPLLRAVSRAWLLLVVLAALSVPGRSGAATPQSCLDPDGRYAVIEPGREDDVRALFAPHVAARPIVGAEAWKFHSIAIAGASITVQLAGPEGARVEVTLRARDCRPGDTGGSASFVFDRAPVEAPEGAAAAAELLERAVRENDRGDFWRSRLEPSSVQQPLRPSRPDEAEQAPAAAPEPTASLPFRRTVAALLVILVLALAGLLVDLPPVARELRLVDRSGRRFAAALLALVAVGGLLRLLPEATFLREAYPLPSIHWMVRGPELEAAILPYPQGPELMAAYLGPLLSNDPFNGWFGTNLLLGTLTIPLAFVATTVLTGRRSAGLVAAALLACWPQHIRLSASEVKHVAFVFWTFAALAWTLLAAANGRLRSFFGATFAAAAAVTTRPEASLVLPGLLLIALGHAEGIRRRLLSPARLLVLVGAGALILPVVAITLANPYASSFGLDSWLDALGDLPGVLLVPDGRNAFFDPQTTPLWLYPLALVGLAWLVRRRAWWTAAGLAMTLLALLTLYATLGPAVTIWKMGRYHAAALPAVVTLAGLGAWYALGWLRSLRSARRRLVAGLTLAGLSLTWWPAIAALPMDWQRSTAWAIELGRRHPELQAEEARFVTPDNRRRFRDLSPRAPVVALSRGRQDIRSAITVEHAIRGLALDGAPSAPTYFYADLYCHLAVGPGEDENPQCAAMRQVFELERMDSLIIDEAAYLSAYVDSRRPPPHELTLYRVVGRKLPPRRGLQLLPLPWFEGALGDARWPLGSSTAAFTEPPQPPIGAPMAPHLMPAPPPF